MNEYKNRVLPLEELAVSAGMLTFIEDNNGDDEPCVRARMVTYWEGKSHRIYFDGRTHMVRRLHLRRDVALLVA